MQGFARGTGRRGHPRRRLHGFARTGAAHDTARVGLLAVLAALLLAVPLAAIAGVGTASAAHPGTGRESGPVTRPVDESAKAPTTAWLCRPGTSGDPCAANLTTTVMKASGTLSTLRAKVDLESGFDCFYVYPTVSTEQTPNADLRVQASEIAAATAQASRFSTVCRVWSPMYRQITLARLFALPQLTTSSTPVVTAYDSLRAGFEDYLEHDNDGRPIIFVGHSQGASMLIRLLQHVVDDDPALRTRLVLAVILGGNVVVPTGKLVGGSFAHIPLCTSPGEAGCVIAYSTFPTQPPPTSLFGRPGKGVSVLAGQAARHRVQVACVNPAAIGGKSGPLVPFFPSEGTQPTPWVEFPQLYSARCLSAGGATWLEVTKISGASDRRHVVTELDGPDWGYHVYDVNLALGNLVADAAAAEATWSRRAHR
ncbi:MAG: DUF3089 domain-containing protein [Acidimicrobiales bacterium]|jgi:hypothetical protein